MADHTRRSWKLIVGLYLFFVFPTPASAHHCGDLSDCYGTITAISLAVLGLGLLISAPYWLPALLARFAITAALRGILASAFRSRLATIGARAASRIAARAWHRATFPNGWRSVVYHWGKHGGARTIGQYSRDAARFFRQYRHLGKPITLRDGTPGIRIKLGKGKPGGIFKPNGKIVTFWYK